MEGEFWRRCADWPDYSVSSYGRVKRSVLSQGAIVGRIIQPGRTSNGYLIVNLRRSGCRKSVKVHRLVCRAWHGPAPSSKHEVAHGDGDKMHNRPRNLRWATKAENAEDRHRLGEFAVGLRHGNGRLTDAAVRLIRQSRGDRMELAREHGITPNYVSEIRLGRKRRAAGGIC
jgi:hypothetical protein